MSRQVYTLLDRLEGKRHASGRRPSHPPPRSAFRPGNTVAHFRASGIAELHAPERDRAETYIAVIYSRLSRRTIKRQYQQTHLRDLRLMLTPWSAKTPSERNRRNSLYQVCRRSLRGMKPILEAPHLPERQLPRWRIAPSKRGPAIRPRRRRLAEWAEKIARQRGDRPLRYRNPKAQPPRARQRFYPPRPALSPEKLATLATWRASRPWAKRESCLVAMT